MEDDNREESAIGIETTPVGVSQGIRAELPEVIETVPVDSTPAGCTIMASKMRQVMLQNANKTFRDISNVVERIQRERSTSQTSMVQEFTNFMASRMGTLNERQQSCFIDKMLEVYIQINNRN